MGKRLTLMLTALLAISTILCLVLYMGGLNPAAEEPMPEFGNMDKPELTALVLVNPDWHGPRAQLAQLLLDEGKAVAALHHMLILAWAEWDMADMQTELVGLISDNPYLAQDCLNTLASQRSGWLWPKELSVQIATGTDHVDQVLANLPPLLKNNSQHPLAEAALAKYLSSKPLVAWDIGLMMTDKLGQVVYTILQLPVEEQSEIIAAIQTKSPKEPLTSVLTAAQLGGEAGLEMLIALEDNFSPWDLGQYTEIKLQLLLQVLPNPLEEKHLRNLQFAKAIALADPIHPLTDPEQSFVLDLLLAMEGLGQEPQDTIQYCFVKSTLLQAVVPREAHLREVTEAYFQHLDSRHLFFVMEDWAEKLHWAGYDEYSLMQDIKIAAGVLALDPQWAHIESVMNPPKPPTPHTTLPSESRRDKGQINRVSLSPDGNQIIYFTANTTWWYDLEEQQYRLAQSIANTDNVSVHWAPNSRSLVLELAMESGNSILHFSLEGTGFPWEMEIKQSQVLGWRDNSTLVLSTSSASEYTISVLDSQSKRIVSIGTSIHQPVLTNTGKIAWANISEKSLTICIQSSETSYNLPAKDLDIAGWLPDDRGVLLRSASGKYYLADTGTGEIVELDFQSFSPHALGWRLDNTITGSFSLGLVNHIMVLDIDDRKMTATGITSYFGNFSGLDYYWHVYAGSIYIYKIR